MDRETAIRSLRRYQDILKPYDLVLNSRAGAFRAKGLFKLYKNIRRLLKFLNITYKNPESEPTIPAIPIYLFEPDPENFDRQRLTTNKVAQNSDN